MYKFKKLYNKLLKEAVGGDAAMPQGVEQGNVQPGNEGQNVNQLNDVERLSSSAEVMLIRDLIRALVITVPNDQEILDLVKNELPDQMAKREVNQFHEQVNSIIEKYSDYENNTDRLKMIDKIIVNEGNRKNVYKNILDLMNKYSN